MEKAKISASLEEKGLHIDCEATIPDAIYLSIALAANIIKYTANVLAKGREKQCSEELAKLIADNALMMALDNSGESIDLTMATQLFEEYRKHS